MPSQRKKTESRLCFLPTHVVEAGAEDLRPRVWRGRAERLQTSRVIAGLTFPQAIDDAHPDVCQSPDSHTVGFALRSFPLVIGQRPGFLQGRLPGELVQGVTQRLQAGEAFVRFGIIAALERHWRSPGQGLDGASISVAGAIIA